MPKKKEVLIEELVNTLSRVKLENRASYDGKLPQYKDMRDGGDGGPWRAGADTSLRDLHYKGWYDEDFQIVLEKLEETTVMSEEDRKEKFSYEKKGLWSKLKETFGG